MQMYLHMDVEMELPMMLVAGGVMPWFFQNGVCLLAGDENEFIYKNSAWWQGRKVFRVEASYPHGYVYTMTRANDHVCYVFKYETFQSLWS